MPTRPDAPDDPQLRSVRGFSGCLATTRRNSKLSLAHFGRRKKKKIKQKEKYRVSCTRCGVRDLLLLGHGERRLNKGRTTSRTLVRGRARKGEIPWSNFERLVRHDSAIFNRVLKGMVLFVLAYWPSSDKVSLKLSRFFCNSFVNIAAFIYL